MKIVKLSEITSKIGSGATPNGGSSVYSDNGISFIRSQNVLDMLFSSNGLVFLNEQQANELRNVAVESGDILLNITGDSIARSCIVPKEILPARVNQHVSIIRCKDKDDSEYLGFYLQYLKPYLLKICRVGGTRNALTKESIGKLPILYPDNRQEKVKILTLINQKIAINNQINAQLEQMAKTLYDYWFVQFDFPDENGKPYQSSGGEMVYNDTLKRHIPKGWEVKSLGEHITIKRGLSYKSNEIQDTGIPFINLNSFYLDGNFKIEGTKFFTGKVKDDDFVYHGDLLIAVTDVTRNADIIGKAFILPDLFNDNAVISCDVAKVHSSKLNNFYLEKLFNSFNYHEYIKHFASGTLVLHLDIKGISWFKTYIPPKILLDKFETFCQSIHQSMAITKKQNQQLTQLRDFLLPMLMNGQVGVLDVQVA